MNRFIASALISCFIFANTVYAEDSVITTYFDKCATNIKRAWFPPAGTEICRGSVCYVLYTDGHVADIKIKESLRNKEADLSMVLAIKNATPFSKPPHEIYCPQKLRVIFDVTHLPLGKPCKIEFADK